MKTVIWIASYPKSGNTWVRFLVCNLVFGPQDSSAALNQLAPDIHELDGAPVPPEAQSFIKTHFPHSDQMPLSAHTAGAVYVVRHPADVMLSNHHYAQRNGTAKGMSLDQYVEQYLAAGGDPRWTQLGMGAWDEHVRSWLAVQQPFPLLFLRYEDLLRDAVASAGQICAFFGLQRSARQLEAAVAGSSFERLRQMEEADIVQRRVGIFYKPYLQSSIDHGLRFMRGGQAGEARDKLSPTQRSRIESRFGLVMRELGYESQEGV